LLHYFSFIWGDPAKLFIFYRGAGTFRSIYTILTKPPILDISTPFAISGLSIKTEQVFDFLVIHTKPQLLLERAMAIDLIFQIFKVNIGA
jgi:hypothetical protein